MKIEQSSQAKAEVTEKDDNVRRKQSPEADKFDLEAFAKEVAEKTATTIAMKQAEAKAAKKRQRRAG